MWPQEHAMTHWVPVVQGLRATPQGEVYDPSTSPRNLKASAFWSARKKQTESGRASSFSTVYAWESELDWSEIGQKAIQRK